MSDKTYRWFIAFLMFLGISVNYIDRVCISHALPLISKEMELSKFQQGLVLSAFSWGYVFLMPFAGWLIIAPIVTGILYENTQSFVAPLAVSGTLGILGAYAYWFIVGKLEPLNVR
jgi:MFS family permease